MLLVGPGNSGVIERNRLQRFAAPTTSHPDGGDESIREHVDPGRRHFAVIVLANGDGDSGNWRGGVAVVDEIARGKILVLGDREVLVIGLSRVALGIALIACDLLGNAMAIGQQLNFSLIVDQRTLASYRIAAIENQYVHLTSPGCSWWLRYFLIVRCLFCRRRQFRHLAQRDSKLVELEVRLEKDYRLVGAPPRPYYWKTCAMPTCR